MSNYRHGLTAEGGGAFLCTDQCLLSDHSLVPKADRKAALEPGIHLEVECPRTGFLISPPLCMCEVGDVLRELKKAGVVVIMASVCPSPGTMPFHGHHHLRSEKIVCSVHNWN